jgi:hypothetical protein
VRLTFSNNTSSQAFEDFERASKLEPGNTFLREKIQKAKETIAAIAQKKKDSTAKYAPYGFSPMIEHYVQPTLPLAHTHTETSR